MFTKISKFKRRLRSLCLYVFKRIENNGNAKFETNGEEKFLLQWFDKIKANKDKEYTFFDVGANIGKYCEMLLNLSQKNQLKLKIFAFEPTKSCLKELYKKFDASTIVNIIPFGASNEAGAFNIYYNAEKSGFASLYQRDLDRINIQMNQSETIKTLRLDAVIKEKNIEHIHFLKIDIEGHEIKALEGLGEYLNTQFIDVIQFEYGGANLDSRTYLKDFYDLFTKKGFKIAKILPTGLELREYQTYMENFDYANYVAFSPQVIE